MSRSSLDLPFAMVLSANIGFAFKGILAKLALATGMTVAGVLMLRAFLALPLLWLVVRMLPRTQAITLRDWRDTLGIGLVFTVSTVADFMAIDHLGAGLSRMVLFTYPLLVQVLVAWREQRWPTRRELLVFSLCYGGLVLMLAPRGWSGQFGPREWIGLACGLTAAASYAIFLTLGQGMIQRVGSPRFTAMMNTSVFAAMLLYAIFGASAQDLVVPPMGAMWMVVMVIFATVAPFLLLFEGLKRTGAKRASLIALSGPAVTVFGAWAILGESLGWAQLAGFVLVLGGMILLRWEGFDDLVRSLRKCSGPAWMGRR